MTVFDPTSEEHVQALAAMLGVNPIHPMRWTYTGEPTELRWTFHVRGMMVAYASGRAPLEDESKLWSLICADLLATVVDGRLAKGQEVEMAFWADLYNEAT